MKKRRFRRLALSRSPLALLRIGIALGIFLGMSLYGLDALPALAPSLPEGQSAPLRVIALDVGQADATLVLTETHTMLIDCGDRGSEGVMDDYLRQYGVSRIDSLVITHPHSDHIGTAPYLLSHYPVGEVLMPAIPDALLPTTDLFFSFLEALERSEATPRTAAVGDRLELGAAVARVIGPAQEFDDLNNISLCMMISLGEAVFLLTGDAESAAERALVESGQPLGCDVLFVGHHGSRTSTSAAFLAAASPRVAVISLGADNRYGHPHPEVLRRLTDARIELYRTDLDGSIHIATDGRSIEITTQNRTFALAA
jgi:competence protein ComEC